MFSVVFTTLVVVLALIVIGTALIAWGENKDSRGSDFESMDDLLEGDL
jgi:hypothetical protein